MTRAGTLSQTGGAVTVRMPLSEQSTRSGQKRSTLRLVSLGFALVGATAVLADVHPHQGMLTPYKGEPPKITLSAADLILLDKGETVMKQSEAGLGGRGMAVQDIAAPTDVVWDRILDFDGYPKMIANVKQIEVYEKNPERVKVRFVIGQFGIKLEYFIDHVVHRDKGFMTWTLDYSRKSELDDSVGYWYVEPHPTRKGETRLYYSVDVRMRGFVPAFVQDMVRQEGLVRATRWVKAFSEKQHSSQAAAGTSP
jgi:carbon monoxide dehydrogenase subunit G